ncbi:glycosyltransferase family 4 protein [Paludicola sp. MB14-C6]|uniref:glycosyltransferase family 4 protein n=1 Tax=Paludihabitans sp. MB14-C6 TaxID=3070656 RepID=UPI0027DD6224|nr:glycosyltransferase family 4 protein [Paludicola sp. MB14-C6]WMJ22933.1 glycosyltransferase family 4 protein [Paludicola sp. MB14-C6]
MKNIGGVGINIVVVSQHYYPDNFRVNDIVKELVNQGHQVKMITGLPDYTTSKVPNEYRFFRKRKEVIDGVNVIRVPTISRRKGVIFRALNYMSFIISGYIYACFCSKKDIDGIFVYQTSPVFQAIPAIRLKKRARCNLTLYCCDLWPESLKAWNVKEDSLLFKVVKRMSSKIYRACNTVAITSTPFKEYLIEVCDVDSEKIQYLPQHAEDLYQSIQGQYIDNNCIDFMFAGNIGSVQNVDCILKAIPNVKTNQKFHVHIVGDGSELDNCIQLSKQLNVENRITFHGRRSLKEMEKFYLMADCLLLTLRGGDFIGMTLPAKSQGYLSCGKPLVGAIDGAGKEMIIKADCGLCGQAGDDKKLAQNMTTLIESFDQYKQKGKNGRAFYEQNYRKEIFMNNLIGIL